MDLHRNPLRSFDKEILTSATTVGALIAGFSSGILVRSTPSASHQLHTDCAPIPQADVVGRKAVIGLADAIFIIGAGSFPPLPRLFLTQQLISSTTVLQAVSFGSGAYWIMAVGRLIIGFGVGLASLVVPYVSPLPPSSNRRPDDLFTQSLHRRARSHRSSRPSRHPQRYRHYGWSSRRLHP